jgi:hypothetical protein
MCDERSSISGGQRSTVSPTSAARDRLCSSCRSIQTPRDRHCLPRPSRRAKRFSRAGCCAACSISPPPASKLDSGRPHARARPARCGLGAVGTRGDGRTGMAAIGLAMHFTVALTATLVFYALSRRIALLRTAPLWIVGPLLRCDCLLRHELRHAAGAVVGA